MGFYDEFIKSLGDANGSQQGSMSPRPSKHDIAVEILRRTNNNYDSLTTQVAKAAKKPVTIKKKDTHISPLSRVLDILSRGMYANAGGVHEINALKDENPEKPGHQIGVGNFVKAFGHGWLQGIEGKTKGSMIDEVKSSHPNMGNKTAAGLGLFMDIGADPTSYIPGAALVKGVKSGIKLAKGGEKLAEANKAVHAVEEVTSKAPSYTVQHPNPVDSNQLPLFDTHEKSNVVSHILKETKKIPKEDTVAKVESSVFEHGPAPAIKPLKPVSHHAMNHLEEKLGIDFSPVRNGEISLPKFLEGKEVSTTVQGVTIPLRHVFDTVLSGKGSLLKKMVVDIEGRPVRINSLRKEVEKLTKTSLGVEKAVGIPLAGTPIVHSAEQIIADSAKGDASAIEKIANKAEPIPVKHEISEAGQRGIDSTLAHAIEGVDTGRTYGKKAANPHFNPAKQVNAFTKLIEHTLKEDMPEGFNKALQGSKDPTVTKIARARAFRSLKALEDSMIAAGPKYAPKDFNGNPLKLSEVIDALGGIDKVWPPGISGEHLTSLFTAKGFKKLMEANPAARQILEESKAAKAVSDANVVDDALRATQDSLSKIDADPTLPFNATIEAERLTPGVARTVAEAAGGSKEAIQTASDYVLDSVKAAEKANPTVHAAKTITPEAAKVSAEGNLKDTGVIGSKLAAASNLKVGVKASDVAKEITTDFASAADRSLWSRFMSAINPAWGMADLNPLLRENSSVFQSATKRYAAPLFHMSKEFAKEDIDAAFKSLQAAGIHNADALSGSQKVAAEMFKEHIDTLFAKSGLKDAINSPLSREAITRDEFNHYLKIVGFKDEHLFQKSMVDEFGKTIDLGNNWQDAWKYMKIDNPLEFLMKAKAGSDLALMDKSLWDTVATTWGKTVPTTGHVLISHPRLKGVYLPREIASQVDELSKRIIELRKAVKHPFIKGLDVGLRMWKSGVTIYSPSHHVRNIIGDSFLMWLGGGNIANGLPKAMRVLVANKNNYSDIIGSANLISRDALGNALEGKEFNTAGNLVTAEPSTVISKLRVKGQPGGKFNLTGRQYYIVMEKKGLLPHAGIIEDLGQGMESSLKGTHSPLTRISPFKGNIQRGARRVSETREHLVRIAHFVDKVEKYSNGRRSLEEVFNMAAADVRKWHPDGLDLTPFERKYMRRIFPFYSWTRKAIPLVVEGAVMHPGKITAYPKFELAMQKMNGINGGNIENPFPADQLFPDWIRDIGIGPVMGSTGHYIDINPSNPAMDLGNQFLNHPIRGALSFANPMFTAPFQMGINQNFQTGAPIPDKTAFLDKQVPELSVVNRLLGTDQGFSTIQRVLPGGSFTDTMSTDQLKGQGTAGPQKNNILNYLTAAGVLDVSKPSYIQGAQYDERARLNKKNSKARKEARVRAAQNANR